MNIQLPRVVFVEVLMRKVYCRSKEITGDSNRRRIFDAQKDFPVFGSRYHFQSVAKFLYEIMIIFFFLFFLERDTK